MEPTTINFIWPILYITLVILFLLQYFYMLTNFRSCILFSILSSTMDCNKIIFTYLGYLNVYYCFKQEIVPYKSFTLVILFFPCKDHGRIYIF